MAILSPLQASKNHSSRCGHLSGLFFTPVLIFKTARYRLVAIPQLNVPRNYFDHIWTGTHSLRRRECHPKITTISISMTTFEFTKIKLRTILCYLNCKQKYCCEFIFSRIHATYLASSLLWVVGEICELVKIRSIADCLPSRLGCYYSGERLAPLLVDSNSSQSQKKWNVQIKFRLLLFFSLCPKSDNLTE